jgi:hypothetical protein
MIRAFWNVSRVSALLLAAGVGLAEISDTTASVRLNNSLIVDIQVTTSGNATRLQVTYWAAGVGPLVSRLTPVSTTGTTTVTIGRLRANRRYTYTVRAINDHGGAAGATSGSFTTGPLPAPLLMNTYTLQGRTTVPLIILPHTQAGFRGYVAFDLHSADAPQIVWYYNNAPSTATGILQVDTVQSIVQKQDGDFLISDGGTGPPPFSADAFYREITPDGALAAESLATCRVTPPAANPAPLGWIWGQGNDIHEMLVPGADGVPGTVLHLGEDRQGPFL